MDCPKCHVGTTQPSYIEEFKQVRSVCNACGWIGPPCYGMKWDASSPKCRGGNDPTYWEENAGHKRPQCSWYRQCAQESALRKDKGNDKMRLPMAAAPQTQAASQPQSTQRSAPLPGLPPPRINLPGLRSFGTQPQSQQPQPHPPLPGLQSVVSNSLLSGIQQGQQKAQQQPPQQVLQPRTPQWQQPQPQVQPQQMVYPQQQYIQMGPQANMPAYIPQGYIAPGQQVGYNLTNPESPDQGWWAMTGWSMARGGMKGALGALIAIIDNVQIGPYFHQQ